MLKVDAGATLYVAPSGSDGNPGSAILPKRSIAGAIMAMTAKSTIYVAEGTYDIASSWVANNPPYDCNVIAVGGRVRSTVANLSLSWAANGTYPNVYQATVAAPYAVIDEQQLTAELNGSWLTSRASLVLVNSNPGSYYASGGVLYVRTVDSRNPNTGHVLVLPTVTLNGFINSSLRTVYVEGIDFLGGSRAMYIATARRFSAVDCCFRYGELEGVNATDTIDSYMFGCRAEENNGDGFSYTGTGKILEVGCKGRANGHDGANDNNGSTSHSAARVIRVGGEYSRNQGPNVADVGDARAWLIDCDTHDTQSGDGTRKVNYWIGEADGVMWLDYCSASDNLVDLYADAGATFYVKETDYTTTGGTVGTVLPHRADV